ncbi:MAG: hypothetical protein EZS28_046610 [Streblomastix strix]|uniref:Uncharacterized protein n=1 Tax=Streblomastix strix TaxID=222440 RepID=A0A5J4TJD0_9EUKA|nr:MAG: hypothetical protein EZS28_046610 [Streblomastix strix]
MAEKEQQSSSSQEQGSSAYDEDMKALLVLAFMPKPEIEAFLADQGFVPPTFDKDDPRFIEKLDALKLYMLSKQMAFEDLTQRFPAMNNTFSKTETQQKMTYAHVANSQEEQLRFFMEYGPRAYIIANSKLGQPVALLPRLSAPPSSVASSIDDSDQYFTHIRKRSANVQKGPLLSPQAALADQNLIDITKRTRGGASAGDTVYQLRVRVDQVALDHLVGISIISDIIIINIATGMANFGKKWPRQQEYIELPISTRTRLNRETPGEGQQSKIVGDTRTQGLLRNQRKYNQMKHHTRMLTVPEQLHSQRAHQQHIFITLYPTNHLPSISIISIRALSPSSLSSN